MRAAAPLSELGSEDRGRFGSKAANLGLLARLGMPVPHGFVLGFEANHSGRLKEAERQVVRERYRVLGGSVAVRSSAVNEDTLDFSFAGQYVTRLDVTGEDAVIAAVEDCLASRTAARVRAYRAGAAIPEAPMGVIVQRMVHPDQAGVCFTRAPDDEDLLVIELVRGSGEALVSGGETPARLALAREGLAERGREDNKSLIDACGAERLREVARLALRAEAALGLPADVEWATAGGEVAILQARPITAGSHAASIEAVRREEIERLRRVAGGRIQVWTDFSVADMFARPSPLGLDVLRRLSRGDGPIAQALAAFGLRYDAGGPEMIESICARAYLNLNRLVESADTALPVAIDARLLPRSADFAFDPENSPLRLAWRGWRSAAALPSALPRWLLLVPFRFFRLRRQFADRFTREIRPAAVAEAARQRAGNLSTLSMPELWARFSTCLAHIDELARHHQITDYLALASHFFLRRHLRLLYGPKAGTVEMQLTTALAGNFNTETNLDLGRVAAGELDLDEFIERYGHRGNPDWEISAPRWREEPRRVEAMASAIARSGVEPQRRFEEQAEIRRRTEERLASNIREHPWLRLFRGSILGNLRTYQRCSPLREATQALCYLWIELARGVVLEAARRLDTGDLFFDLTLPELESLLAHGDRAGPLRAARERRERRRVARRIHVPHVVRSDDLEAIGRPPSVDSSAVELRGQSVSAGIARGRARVVRDLAEAGALEAGEILVATSADPSWTPLFLIAGGLVLEQGGMLSHPAIVAREYGLPAVVNVPHATRQIRSGQEVTVDAEAGRVLLEGGAEPAPQPSA